MERFINKGERRGGGAPVAIPTSKIATPTSRALGTGPGVVTYSQNGGECYHVGDRGIGSYRYPRSTAVGHRLRGTVAVVSMRLQALRAECRKRIGQPNT